MKQYKVTCLEKLTADIYQHKIVLCSANSHSEAIKKVSKATGLPVTAVQFTACNRIK